MIVLLSACNSSPTTNETEESNKITDGVTTDILAANNQSSKRTTSSSLSTEANLSITRHPKLSSCSGCHGPGSTLPSIMGQPQEQLYKTLQAFAQDTKDNTVMGRIARGYSNAELKEISQALAKLTSPHTVNK